jgi:hypothetical protein
MIWRDLITIRVTDGYSLAIDIGPLVIALFVVGAALWAISHLSTVSSRSGSSAWWHRES